MLVLCPSNSTGHTYMGSRFEFHRGRGWVSSPLHHGGVFALEGSAPSRVYYLAGTNRATALCFWIPKMWGWEGAIDGTHTCSDRS